MMNEKYAQQELTNWKFATFSFNRKVIDAYLAMHIIYKFFPVTALRMESLRLKNDVETNPVVSVKRYSYIFIELLSMFDLVWLIGE